MQIQTTQAHAPTPPKIADPTFTPLPPTSATTDSLDFEIGINGLRHIDDPTGQERRLFEGWASLGGLDYQGHEIQPDAFEKMAAAYLAKNPVILWDHIRHLPIGTVHSLTTTDEGLYIQGEIWRLSDLDWDDEAEAKKAKKQKKVYVGTESIAAKCNEVWALMRTGKIRGLSIRGKARQYVAVYSPELKRHVPRVTEVLLYEISVTPTQVHPGAKIVAVNTLSKSLELIKALPLVTCGEGSKTGGDEPKTPPTVETTNHRALFRPARMTQGGPMNFDKIRQLQQDLADELRALGGEAGEVEIPVDVAQQLKEFGSAVDFEGLDEDGNLEKGLDLEDAKPDEDEAAEAEKEKEAEAAAQALPDFEAIMEKALGRHLVPVMERLDALEENRPSATAAPRTARIRVKPEGARGKPTGAQGISEAAALEKALEIIANSRHGRADLGEGEYHGCGLPEAAQLACFQATTQGHFFPESGQMTLSPAAQRLLNQCREG